MAGRVRIEYCVKCKWMLRAAWLAQELLSTFERDSLLAEVALAPNAEVGGVFEVTCNGEPLWSRKVEGRFPEAKELKQRLRDLLAPGKSLGHVDGHKAGEPRADGRADKPPADAGKEKEDAEDRKTLDDAGQKQLKQVVKEGGKRGVEIEGAADMGGLQFFCTSVDEVVGDMEMIVESMRAMNAQPTPGDEERKGCSGHIGKMIFSAGDEQLAVAAYVPQDKQGELECEEWISAVLALFNGEVLTRDKTLSTGRVKTDSHNNIFPLKIREPMILEANNFLRKKGLFPEDKDSDDEMVFGDDDFPS